MPGANAPNSRIDRCFSGDAEERFASLLEDSVGMRLMSDVPVGLFMSGGVDSGMMAALVKRVHTKPVQTFSIGFDTGDDELSRARALASMLGTQHEELTLSPRDLGVLPRIIWHLDEPIGDSIILPMYGRKQ